MAEGNTWEEKENLENAKELVEEFEKEYSRDIREVRQQEKQKEEKDYWRESFLGRFVAKMLFGWNNRRYDRKYWDCMDRNWKKWKGTRSLEQRRLELIKEVREEEEYQGGKIKE